MDIFLILCMVAAVLFIVLMIIESNKANKKMRSKYYNLMGECTEKDILNRRLNTRIEQMESWHLIYCVPCAEQEVFIKACVRNFHGVPICEHCKDVEDQNS